MIEDHFLREYLKVGLSDIVIVEQKEVEKESGSYDHTISETVIARKGNCFVRVTATNHTNRYKSRGTRIDLPEPISAGEYALLATGKTIIDTVEARARIAHQNEIALHRAELEKKLHSLAARV